MHNAKRKMSNQFFFVLPQEFKDVNTGDLVKCGFDDQNNIADPDAWGMVRFHPHAPTQLLYPPAPTYHKSSGCLYPGCWGYQTRTVCGERSDIHFEQTEIDIEL
jgi:hypothetical protein